MVSQSPYEIVIRWLAPGDRGMPITSYSIYWTGVNPDLIPPEYTFMQTVPAVTLEQSIISVVPGKTYSFKVLATSDAGDSALSSYVTIMAAQRPDQPVTPELVYQSSTTITFDWTPPSDNFNAISEYRIYWDQGVGAPFELLGTSAGNSPIFTKDASTLPELVPGEYYEFKVSAVNAIGESDISASVRIIASTVPDAPLQPRSV